jgi:hypothetical protein
MIDVGKTEIHIEPLQEKENGRNKR